jgi:hypothetical protein
MVETNNNTGKFFLHFSKEGHKFLTLVCNVILPNACIKMLANS